MPNRTVELITDVWVQATTSDTLGFRTVNESTNKVLWIADKTQPPTNAASLRRAVTLTTTESMSRFNEMTPDHLWLMGKTGEYVVVIDQ